TLTTFAEPVCRKRAFSASRTCCESSPFPESGVTWKTSRRVSAATALGRSFGTCSVWVSSSFFFFLKASAGPIAISSAQAKASSPSRGIEITVIVAGRRGAESRVRRAETVSRRFRCAARQCAIQIATRQAPVPPPHSGLPTAERSFRPGVELLQNPTFHLRNTRAVLEIRKQERALAPHLARVALHHFERRTHVRRQIDFVDHQQIRPDDARAALA